MGSVIDGEDVVQDTLARALTSLHELAEPAALRAWLFRIAHNRALDLLRGRALRDAQPIEAAEKLDDPTTPDPVETIMRHEAINTAISRFTELPTVQRSVVILKDVLGEPLADIAQLLGLSVDAVKAHLARGRTRLREINARSVSLQAYAPSEAVVRYVTLFNRHDWTGLRALLADDVKLVQSSHAPRSGAADVSMFFSGYATIDGVRLAPAWLEGREVIAVFDRAHDPKPGYFMWLEWRDDRIVFIRDYRYDRYVAQDAELVVASS